MYLTRFRTYKMARLKTKAKEGRGPQTKKYLSQSPFPGHFFLMTTFCIAFYQPYLSTDVI
jgi:hypothetical protein